MYRRSAEYRKLFFRHYGFGPYDCFFCGKPVPLETFLIHHENHDPYDDRLENLQPTHRPCHKEHHLRCG